MITSLKETPDLKFKCIYNIKIFLFDQFSLAAKFT